MVLPDRETLEKRTPTQSEMRGIRMHRVSTICLILASLLFTHFPTHAGDARDLRRNDAAQIDAMIHAYDRPDAPGISVMVVRDHMVVYKKACGLADVEARVPNTTNTNFRLASVTKQFTAMAILILMERGKLSLESRLVDFFPDFPAYGREITIRQLLNHTSGLPDYAALIPAGQEQQLSDNDVLRILKQPTKGDFLPGSKFEYSNSGYVVLGLIAAKVSRKSFARFLEESIFQPLGMSSTVAYEPGISTVKNRAYGYTPSGKTFRRTDQSLTSATLGDGGIYSSVEDLYRWDQALNTTKLVGTKTLEQAFSPGNFGKGQTSNYGFGWFLDTVGGIRAASHGGTTVGFRNHIVRLPDEKFTVIVLMNRSDGVPAEIANNIARNYCPDFAGSPRLR
jgi:CubicO group peptidase (beta-lactamase class C family)